MRNERTNGKQVRPVTGRTIPEKRVTLQPVRFEYLSSGAREVAVAGSFNNWDVSSARMVRAVRGRWLRVMFLPPGRFEYLFVVDGRCVADPRATESVPNVFGCVNSVVSVPEHRPRNGCARITGRKPVMPLRTPAKLRTRVCRGVNPRRYRSGPEHTRITTIV